MKKVLEQIGNLISKDNKKYKFTITGFGFIDIIVEIAYEDCYAYYIAKYDKDSEYKDLKFVGYSKDHEDLGDALEWRKIYKRINASKASAVISK